MKTTKLIIGNDKTNHNDKTNDNDDEHESDYHKNKLSKSNHANDNNDNDKKIISYHIHIFSSSHHYH